MEIDFDEISQLHPRRVTGTHLYAGISNFTALLGAAEEESAEGLLLQLHLFAREATRIIKNDFDGCKVHFQGPRVHALAYRPVGDETAMAAKGCPDGAGAPAHVGHVQRGVRADRPGSLETRRRARRSGSEYSVSLTYYAELAARAASASGLQSLWTRSNRRPIASKTAPQGRDLQQPAAGRLTATAALPQKGGDDYPT
jgi:hypothetical protein